MDLLTKIEKNLKDLYIQRGFSRDDADWGFKIQIETIYKNKRLLVYFQQKKDIEYEIMRIEKTSTLLMLSSAYSKSLEMLNEFKFKGSA